MLAVRFVMCAAGALAVSGCLAPVPDSNPRTEADGRAGLSAFFARTTDRTAGRTAPLAKASLAGGDVVVAGPEGYCIDPTTKSSGPERGFAVIASCNILTGGKSGPTVEPMLVTVTVGPRGDMTDLPTPDALAEASGAVLVSWKITSDRVTAHLASGGEAMFDGSDPQYWRSAFLQGERMVGLALYAPRGSALAGDRGAVMLARVKDRIATLSKSGQPPVKTVAKTPTPVGGLFGRLFNNQDLP